MTDTGSPSAATSCGGVSVQQRATYPEAFLPDFCRRQWVSAEARRLWEPRITAIGQQFEAAERSSVQVGIRAAALQSISPDAIPDISSRASRSGLVVTVLKTQGRADPYAASATPASNGRPWDYRIALTTRLTASMFAAAFEAGDDETMGELLGYPKCCRSFFAATWASGSVDPTWEMAGHGDGPAEANILLRWLGVRYVPHLPCGFKCELTAILGRRIGEGIPGRERQWMDELLQMPMLWSSVHSIGEVVTPIVRLNFRSDVCHERRELRRLGTNYPDAGAHGLTFPFRPPPARRSPATLWQDNGFGDLQAMESAHRTVVAACAPYELRAVVDLGCGNGMLARKLASASGKAYGVERDTGRATRAANYVDDVVCGDLFQSVKWERRAYAGWNPDAVVLMPGRLVERKDKQPRDVKTLLTAIRRIRAVVVVYAYGDWLERYRSLLELCRAGGMTGTVSRVVTGAGAAAGIWEWSGGE